MNDPLVRYLMISNCGENLSIREVFLQDVDDCVYAFYIETPVKNRIQNKWQQFLHYLQHPKY